MTIVVEDGTGVDGANSYVTVEELQAYAEARGLEFNEDRAETALINAMDYIEVRSYVGTPVHATAFPRDDLTANDRRYGSDVIPQAVKLAQMAAAMAEMGGTRLLPTVAANARGAIRERRIGPITTVYAVARDAGSLPRVPLVDAYLAPYEVSAGHMRVFRA